jgi:hypothetical protein
MKETKIIAAVVYYDVESSEDCYRYIDHEFSIRVEREKEHTKTILPILLLP